MQDTDTIRWRGYEHSHKEHSTDWYWALGIVTLSTALIAILFSDPLFALLIGMAGLTVGMAAARPSPELEMSFTTKGLVIGHDIYPYLQMRAFWIDDEAEEPRLLLDTPRLLAPDIIVPIPEEYVDAIRARLLAAKVAEIPMEEPLPHRIMEFLGF